MPVNRVLLTNSKYGPTPVAGNDIKSGIINFATGYNNLTAYKSSGIDEHTGIIGEIGFKVLKKQNTSIRLKIHYRCPGNIGNKFV